MKMTAIYRDGRSGDMRSMVREEPTKRAFIKSLRDNDLRVIAVLTDTEIVELKELKPWDMLLANGKLHKATKYHEFVLECL